jgi:hypothetical protein
LLSFGTSLFGGRQYAHTSSGHLAVGSGTRGDDSDGNHANEDGAHGNHCGRLDVGSRSGLSGIGCENAFGDVVSTLFYSAKC